MTDKTKSARSAGIIIHNNQLLLMYRKKDELEYYTFPGGTIETNETPPTAAIREITEETSLHTNINRLLYSLDIISDHHVQHEYFYLCHYISGNIALPKDSIEFARSHDKNYYEPMWIPIHLVEQLKLYPLEIKEQLIHDLQHGFTNKPHHMTLKKSELRQT